MGIRSFVSVDVDDSKALDALELAQSRLENTGADLKLVERENIHLTMRFLGDVHENLLDEVIDLFSSIVTEKFSAQRQRFSVQRFGGIVVTFGFYDIGEFVKAFRKFETFPM